MGQPPSSVLALCLHAHRAAGPVLLPAGLGAHGPKRLRTVKAQDRAGGRPSLIVGETGGNRRGCAS